MNGFNDEHYYINRRFMMCEAHAYLLKEDGEEILMENVDLLEVEGDEVRMVDIFGEQKILKARIRSYNGTENRILLEAIGLD
jgi:predicted RNA-binding protein